MNLEPQRERHEIYHNEGKGRKKKAEEALFHTFNEKEKKKNARWLKSPYTVGVEKGEDDMTKKRGIFNITPPGGNNLP